MEERVIIVGTGLAGKTIASAILQESQNQVIGFLGDNGVSGEITILNRDKQFKIPILGTSEQIHEVIQRHQIGGVILATEHRNNRYLLNEIVKCHQAGIAVHEMPELYERLLKKLPVRHVDHEWIAPNLTAPPHDMYALFHDATNYLLSILGLICIIPLFPFFGLAIKLDSKGPIFYRQTRVGKNGRPFELNKFRTMVIDADQAGDMWTKKNDTRITRVGRWLRKYRLDELPQLFNVLRGDMALIGPRPDAANLAEQFSRDIPFYDYRHLVRPGITGWAQVNHGNTCSIEGALEKLQYDFYWIKNRSYWLDLTIILRSIKVMLTGYGAV